MTNLKDKISYVKTRKSGIPDFIYMDLRTLISNGAIGKDDKLPSESELAMLYRTSRTTIREALNKLQQEGTIIRKQGVGTFVGPSYSLVSRLDVNMGGTELIQSLGKKPGICDLCISVIRADDQTSRKLDVKIGAELVTISRFQTANNIPVIFSVEIFPINLLKRFGRELDLFEFTDLINQKLSISKVFEEFFGIDIEYGIAKIYPAIAGSVLPEKMGVLPDTLVMRIDQINYDHSGKPILASEHFYASSFFTFTIFRKKF